MRYLDGVLVESSESTMDIDINIYIDSVKSKVISEFLSDIQILNTMYPLEERESWAIQLEEAKSYLLDNSSETPLISNMSKERNISVEEMSNKIISNSNNWKELYGKALGKKQSRMDKLEVLDLTDPDILNHIENI